MKATLTLSPETEAAFKMAGARLAHYPAPYEHAEQAALVRWWEWRTGPDLMPLLFAIANGGRRDKRTAAMLKREGVRAGVPDMFLAYPNGGYHGLWLEMKRREGGRLSAAQEDMLARLEAQGYAVCVCRGCNEGMDAITRYMEQK